MIPYDHFKNNMDIRLQEAHRRAGTYFNSSYFWHQTRPELSRKSLLNMAMGGEFAKVSQYIAEYCHTLIGLEDNRPNPITLDLLRTRIFDFEYEKLKLPPNTPRVCGHTLYSDNLDYILTSNADEVRTIPIRVVAGIQIQGKKVYP